MSAVIGALRANLGIDTAQFSTGLKKAKADLGGFQSTLKSFAAGAVAALSFGAAIGAIRGVVDHLDDVGKAAQKLGTTTQGFSKLQYSAELANVGTEQLTTSVGKLTVQMGDIASGKSNDAKLALDALGLSVTDAGGKLKDTSSFFSEIAAKFSVLKDGAGKNALAMAIFGKSYADLIPLLNAGADGLKKDGDELDRLGATVTPQASQAAQDFNDNMTRLTAAGQGLLQQALIPILPLMVDLTNQFVDFAKSDDARGYIQAIADAMKGLTLEIQQDIKLFAIFNDLMNSTSLDETSKNFGRFTQAMSDASSEYATLQKNLALGVTTTAPGKGDLPSIQTKEAPKIDFGGEARKRAAASDAERAAKEKLREAEQAWNDELAKGKSTFDDTRTPLEAYNIRIAELNKLLKEGVISQDTFNRAQQQAVTDRVNGEGSLLNYTEELKTQFSIFEGFGEALKSTAGSWFDSAIEGTFKLKTALGDLLKTLAKLAFSNLLKGLFSGAGGNDLYGGGGGGILSGLGSLFGFASGGTIMPGGTGGIDSQVVAFRKSPNERVDISKPGQSITSTGGGSNVTYHIDARGADAQQIAVLRQQLSDMSRNFGRNVKAVVAGEKHLSPRFAT